MNKPCTIWILEDNRRYRENLARLLDAQPGFSVPFHAADCETALEKLERLRRPPPDILLLDLGLPGMGGLAGIPKFRAAAPACEIIVLTVSDEKMKVFNAIAAGASGYLLKTSSVEDIAQAIRDVLAGGSPLTPQIARYVVSAMNARQTTTPETTLSEQEKAILDLLSEGYLQKQVADQMGISAHTVDYHVRKIYKKLHCTNITSAVTRAIRDGLI